MAGTNRSKEFQGQGPVIILVRPQLGMNIGMCARAMLNCGLVEMRLVAPRDPWPNEDAFSASSGAVEVLDKARLFSNLEEALADLHFVYATTARDRHMTKPIFIPEAAMNEAKGRLQQGKKVGVMFGPERSGLENDDLSLANALINIPLNPAFSSLNLAQAVLLVGYEWFKGQDDTPASRLEMGDGRPASREEVLNFYAHLERELDACGFLRLADKRPGMVRNIRNIFNRAELTEQEVRTLHGIITELVTKRKRDLGPAKNSL